MERPTVERRMTPRAVFGLFNILVEFRWFRRRLRSAWNVLTDRSFEMGSAEVWCSPESWRCTRCGGGFGGSLVVPPNDRAWRMEHKCYPKSIGVGTKALYMDPANGKIRRQRRPW